MTLTCRAAILRETGAARPYAQSQPISIEEVELLPPQASEVLVKIGGAGLCHSDLSVIDGTRARPLPLAMGHEGAGEIVEIGAAITDLAPGDHVVFQFSASCGRCRRCQEGRPQICEPAAAARSSGGLMGGGRRIRDASGEMVAHQAGVSCFAEYAVLDRGSIVKIDKDFSLADAAVFGCAVMTGAGAVINTARILPGDTVAIIGLGGVGLSGVMGAALAGAEAIVAIDLDDGKLQTAMGMGATHAVNARDRDCVEKVRDLTNGGVDHAVELAGSVAALRTSYQVTRRGGQVVTAGLSPAGAEFAFEHAQLVSEEKAIRGSYMGSCVPVRDIPRFISLYRQGRLPVDRLIDGYIGMDGLNAGFDRLADGAALRQILTPHGL